MEVHTPFIHSASITRGVTNAKPTHTVAGGRYTTAPLIFSLLYSPSHRACISPQLRMARVKLQLTYDKLHNVPESSPTNNLLVEIMIGSPLRLKIF